MSITSGGLLFHLFEFAIVKPGDTYSAKPKALVKDDDTTNGATIKNYTEGTVYLAAAATANIFPTELGTPASGLFQICMKITYDSTTLNTAQFVNINKDGLGAAPCQWVYCDSFDTSLTVNNPTANAVEINYVIFDCTDAGGI